MDRNAPVVGLLFGIVSPDNSHTTTLKSDTASTAYHLQITDADDIPTDSSEAAARQVSLHQAVFPQHSVIGWYRVASPSEATGRGGVVPSADDLRLTRTLEQHYSTLERNKQNETESNLAHDSSAVPHPFIFALLEAPVANETVAVEEGEENEDDDLLPLTLYKLHADQSVLEALQEWKLETSDPERIAVERVIREQPQRPAEASGPASAAAEAHYTYVTEEIDTSLQAIYTRLTIVANFLQDMQSGKLPVNYALLRQCQGLLLQMGPLATPPRTHAAASSSSLVHIGMLAKTVDAVQTYSDKFRILQEAPSASSSRGPLGVREARRF